LALYSWSVAKLGMRKMILQRGYNSLLRNIKRQKKGLIGGVSHLRISLLSLKGPKCPKMRLMSILFWRIWTLGLAMARQQDLQAASLINNFWLGMALTPYLKDTHRMNSRKNQMSHTHSKVWLNLSKTKLIKKRGLGRQKLIRMDWKFRRNLMILSKLHIIELRWILKKMQHKLPKL
jgi:hypothetical protein